jgi:hypothetical protein
MNLHFEDLGENRDKLMKTIKLSQSCLHLSTVLNLKLNYFWLVYAVTLHERVACSFRSLFSLSLMSLNPQEASLKIKFVIIGGGIAGLACSFALKNSGHEVVVVEKHDAEEKVCPQLVKRTSRTEKFTSQDRRMCSLTPKHDSHYGEMARDAIVPPDTRDTMHGVCISSLLLKATVTCYQFVVQKRYVCLLS